EQHADRRVGVLPDTGGGLVLRGRLRHGVRVGGRGPQEQHVTTGPIRPGARSARRERTAFPVAQTERPWEIGTMFDSFCGSGKHQTRRGRRPDRRRCLPRLEALEERSVPTYFVTTILDNGNNGSPTPGSLRAAIIAANKSPGPINFNLGTDPEGD